MEQKIKGVRFSEHMPIFLTPAVVRTPLATPSSSSRDSASSAPVTARPTRGGDALDDHAGCLPLRLRIIRHLLSLFRSAAIRSRGRSKLTNSVSTSVPSQRFTITFSPRSSRCSQSIQRRNASTPLGKRDCILLFSSGRSASSFGAKPPVNCRSWLSQAGISLASAAFRSCWIRLELSRGDARDFANR
jgi:hypothetical protein